MPFPETQNTLISVCVLWSAATTVTKAMVHNTDDFIDLFQLLPSELFVFSYYGNVLTLSCDTKL